MFQRSGSKQDRDSSAPRCSSNGKGSLIRGPTCSANCQPWGAITSFPRDRTRAHPGYKSHVQIIGLARSGKRGMSYSANVSEWSSPNERQYMC